MTNDLVVEIDGISKRFAGHVAVTGLSLRVPRGAVYGLLGPNGAGKTTTIRMMMNITIPDEGTVSLFGDALGGRHHSARIGYLPEERGLYKKMKVRDVLVFLGEAKGVARATAAAKADEWLGRLGLAEWRLRKVEELSKGMQQKVQFISTMLHEPELLILDEPFSGLDPINAQVLKDTIVQLERGGTHVAVSFEDGQDSGAALAGVSSLIAKKDDYGVYAELQLADGADPQELLERLMRTGARLRRFERVEPSLHRIFLDVAGPEAAGADRQEDGAHA